MVLPPAAVVDKSTTVGVPVSLPQPSAKHDKRAVGATGRKPASPCAADPTVQAAVARLSAGKYSMTSPPPAPRGRSKWAPNVLFRSNGIMIDFPRSCANNQWRPLAAHNRMVGCCEYKPNFSEEDQLLNHDYFQFSDRHGRTTILAISLFGLLVTDFTIILVYYFSEHLPGNYWFLMVGAVVEGLFGGKF